jgi:hypothetical protein
VAGVCSQGVALEASVAGFCSQGVALTTSLSISALTTSQFTVHFYEREVDILL